LTDEQVAVSYGKQRGASSSKYSEHRVFRRWFPEQSTMRQPHPFCNNANAAIRRDLWEKQPYDEALPGLEDLAWARKAQEQGCGIAYVPEAEVIHVHHETWRGIYNRYRREGMAFKQIYPQETFRFSDFLRLWFGNVWTDWRTASREGLLGREWANVIRFRLMQFWGTYQGYRRSGPLTWHLKQTFYYPHAYGGRGDEVNQREVQPIKYER
jgi:rhamnosyltransferase